MSDKNLPTDFDSASRCPSRTNRSRSSRSSRSSHSSHTSRKSTDTLVEFAALKVKSQYIDKEAKQKAELDRVRTEMKLQMAQDKLEALETARNSGDEKSQLAPEVDANHKVKNFLKTHKINNEPLFENAAGPSLTGSDVLFEDQTLTKEVKTSQSPSNPDTPQFVPQQPAQYLPATTGEFMNSTNAPDNQPPALLAGHGIHSQRTDWMGDYISGDALRERVKSLAGQVILSRLPPTEPSVFYGDPMRYPSWKIAFHTLIEYRRIPAGEKLHYQKKYISGQVKDTEESYLLLPPVEGKFYLISLHWPVYVNRSMRERHSCFCLLTPAVSHISCSSYFVDERLSAVELKLFDLLIPGFV